MVMTAQEKGTAPLSSQPRCSEIKLQIFSKGSWSHTHSQHTMLCKYKRPCVHAVLFTSNYTCLPEVLGRSRHLRLSGVLLASYKHWQSSFIFFELAPLLFTLLLLSVALTKSFSFLRQGSFMLLFLYLESYVQRFIKHFCSIQTGDFW